MVKKFVQQGPSEQLTMVLPSLPFLFPQDGAAESSTARVERVHSDRARSVSTGIHRAIPPLAEFFSILL